jgi:hypothetical protein
MCFRSPRVRHESIQVPESGHRVQFSSFSLTVQDGKSHSCPAFLLNLTCFGFRAPMPQQSMRSRALRHNPQSRSSQAGSEAPPPFLSVSHPGYSHPNSPLISPCPVQDTRLISPKPDCRPLLRVRTPVPLTWSRRLWLAMV